MPRKELPLAAGDGPLLRFAADLRRLRQRVGGPSCRELSARAHYSIATLSSAAAGHRLPTLEVTLAYVRARGADTEEWRRRWHGVAAELACPDGAREEPPDGDTAASGEHDRAPYAGLAAYRSGDSQWFFGRERVIDDLVGRLADRRFIAVFGASGAGRTSLLRAGLVPRLESGHRRVIVFTPGPRPMEEIAVRLARPAARGPRSRAGEPAPHAARHRRRPSRRGGRNRPRGGPVRGAVHTVPQRGGTDRVPPLAESSPPQSGTAAAVSSWACAPTSTPTARGGPSWWKSCATPRPRSAR
jgi:hypothetical protein